MGSIRGVGRRTIAAGTAGGIPVPDSPNSPNSPWALRRHPSCNGQGGMSQIVPNAPAWRGGGSIRVRRETARLSH
jgi:hypothetical protein